MKKVLIIEDDYTIADLLEIHLADLNCIITKCSDGEDGLKNAITNTYDLIVLDLMLPEVDGFEVCRRIRKKLEVPIIMLTARSEDIDKVLGLELGADDYLTKPFNSRELVARIKAILRRSVVREEEARKLIQIGRLQVDLLQHRVRLGEQEVGLTSKEFALLSFLAANAGNVYSREQLLEQVWGYNYYGDVRTVDVHIRHLREKLEKDPGNPELIITVWGTGYKIREDL